MWRRVDLVWTYVSEERRLTQNLHGATSQKTAFFIVTAVKPSNLHLFFCFPTEADDELTTTGRVKCFSWNFIKERWCQCAPQNYPQSTLSHLPLVLNCAPDFLKKYGYPLCKTMTRAFVRYGGTNAEDPEGPVRQVVQIWAADGSSTIGSVPELPPSE
jgi:hypothetical protein